MKPGARVVNKLTESQVVSIWRYHLFKQTRLTSEDGEPIKIIYPGRSNDDRGADFREAVISMGGKLIKGDIEIHTSSRDWQAHQHHQDTTYNRVILHVVMWHNSSATSLQNGRKIPVLALKNYLRVSGRRWAIVSPATSNLPCDGIGERRPPQEIAGLLNNAGEQRFLAKAARFRADLARLGVGQSLYEGIMEALGYARNKLAFLELARRLPLSRLESMIQDAASDEDCRERQQALLLGTAGLLPSQRRDSLQSNQVNEWMDGLERRWADFRLQEVMPPDAWHLFKVRPSNSPIRRILAMGCLLSRYRERGILAGMISLVAEASAHQADRLESALQVITDGHGTGLALLGNSRAADIIVNVLLPFTFVWSQTNSRTRLGRKAFELYHHYPRLAVNAVERHMRRHLGLSSRLVNSAQRQQGLLHIYRKGCTQGQCECCPLSKA